MSYPYSFLSLSKDCYDYFLSLEVDEESFNDSWMVDEISYSEFQSLLRDFKSKLGYTPSSGYGIYIPTEDTAWSVDFYVTDFLYENNENCASETENSYVVVYSSTQVAYGPY